jgi:hypothetical protein
MIPKPLVCSLIVASVALGTAGCDVASLREHNDFSGASSFK